MPATWPRSATRFMSSKVSVSMRPPPASCPFKVALIYGAGRPHREVNMTIRVELGKRAEKYAVFAAWCKDHKMSPWVIAECIELCIRINRNPKWDHRNRMLDQAKERLFMLGA